jgi:hypothetical protein
MRGSLGWLVLAMMGAAAGRRAFPLGGDAGCHGADPRMRAAVT